MSIEGGWDNEWKDVSGGLGLVFFLGVHVATLILLAGILLLNFLFLQILSLGLFLMHFLLTFLLLLASLHYRHLVCLHFSFLLGGRLFLLCLRVVHVEDGQVADVGRQRDLQEVASVGRQDLIAPIVEEIGGRPKG